MFRIKLLRITELLEVPNSVPWSKKLRLAVRVKNFLLDVLFEFNKTDVVRPILNPYVMGQDVSNVARKGNNLAHKGKYSSTLTGRLRAQAWASSNHYSLVRP